MQLKQNACVDDFNEQKAVARLFLFQTADSNWCNYHWKSLSSMSLLQLYAVNIISDTISKEVLIRLESTMLFDKKSCDGNTYARLIKILCWIKKHNDPSYAFGDRGRCKSFENKSSHGLGPRNVRKFKCKERERYPVALVSKVG